MGPQCSIFMFHQCWWGQQVVANYVPLTSTAKLSISLGIKLCGCLLSLFLWVLSYILVPSGQYVAKTYHVVDKKNVGARAIWWQFFLCWWNCLHNMAKTSTLTNLGTSDPWEKGSCLCLVTWHRYQSDFNENLLLHFWKPLIRKPPIDYTSLSKSKILYIIRMCVHFDLVNKQLTWI